MPPLPLKKADPFAEFQQPGQPAAVDPFAEFQQPATAAAAANASLRPFGLPAGASLPSIAAPDTSYVKPAPGMLDRLAQWGANKFPQLSAADEDKNPGSGTLFALPANTGIGTTPNPLPSPLRPIDRAIANCESRFVRGALATPTGLVDAANSVVDPQQFTHPLQYNQQRIAKNAQAGTPIDMKNPPNLDLEHLADYRAHCLTWCRSKTRAISELCADSL